MKNKKQNEYVPKFVKLRSPQGLRNYRLYSYYGGIEVSTLDEGFRWDLDKKMWVNEFIGYPLKNCYALLPCHSIKAFKRHVRKNYDFLVHKSVNLQAMYKHNFVEFYCCLWIKNKKYKGLT